MPKAIFVDDNPGTISYTVSAFEDYGFEVTVCVNPVEFRNLIADNDFDVAVIDRMWTTGVASQMNDNAVAMLEYIRKELIIFDLPILIHTHYPDDSITKGDDFSIMIERSIYEPFEVAEMALDLISKRDGFRNQQRRHIEDND